LAFFLWDKDVAEQNNGTEDSKDNQENKAPAVKNAITAAIM